MIFIFLVFLNHFVAKCAVSKPLSYQVDVIFLRVINDFMQPDDVWMV